MSIWLILNIVGIGICVFCFLMGFITGYYERKRIEQSSKFSRKEK